MDLPKELINLDTHGRTILDWSFDLGYSIDSYKLSVINEWLKVRGFRMVQPDEIITIGTSYIQASNCGWIAQEALGPYQVHSMYVIHAIKIQPVKKQEITQTPLATKDDEHARMMRFFFNVGPTDPNKLPNPPRAIARSWDDLNDW